MNRALFWTSGIMALIIFSAPSAALDQCRVKLDRKNGTILVGAKPVAGTLHWGGSVSSCTNDVFDGTCVADGVAKNCTLDAPGTLAARTAPFDCTVDLCDDVSQIECYIKGCTVRPEPPVCGAGEVLSWDGYEFQCVPDNAGPGGTVTTVNTGAGLSGGPITTSGAIQINAPICPSDRKLTWSGTDFQCPADSVGVTMLNSGPGLSGGPITTTGALQISSPICPANMKLMWTGSSFTCMTDQDTTYAPGNQLALVGTTFSVVDGSGSGLDADFLDGLSGSNFALVVHPHNLNCSYQSSTAFNSTFHSVSCPAGSIATGGGGFCNAIGGGKVAVHGTYPYGIEQWGVSCLTAADITVTARCCTIG